MTITEQNARVEEFFGRAVAVLQKKSRDYAPDDLALIEVMYTAAEVGATVPAVLFFGLKKHLTAVTRWIATSQLDSEPIDMRLGDIANFVALIALYAKHTPQLHRVWRRHVTRHIPCTCSGTLAKEEGQFRCAHHLYLQWLDAHPQSGKVSHKSSANLALKVGGSRLTRKARG